VGMSLCSPPDVPELVKNSRSNVSSTVGMILRSPPDVPELVKNSVMECAGP
jgi:hypothetical protein